MVNSGDPIHTDNKATKEDKEEATSIENSHDEVPLATLKDRKIRTHEEEESKLEEEVDHVLEVFPSPYLLPNLVKLLVPVCFFSHFLQYIIFHTSVSHP